MDPGGVVRSDLVWFAVVLAAAIGDWLGVWDLTVPAYLAVWLVGASISALPMYRTALLGGFGYLALFWRITGPQSVRLFAALLRFWGSPSGGDRRCRCASPTLRSRACGPA